MAKHRARIANVSMFLFLLAPFASAQFVVSDPTNLAQTTLTALNTLAQLQNQVEQMKRDLEYTTKQLKSLGELGWEDSYNLQKHLDFFDSLRNRTDSLTYDYRQVDEKFRSLYSTKDKPVEQKISEWNAQSEASMLAVMKSHGIIDDSDRKMKDVSRLIEKQRQAQGDLAAIQVLGELSKIQSQQLEELKTIITLDSRAKQSVAMETHSNENATKTFYKHMNSDLRRKEKRKKPPMRKLPSLGHGVE